MRAPAAPFPDDRQRQSLQRFQQALSRGTGGSPLRVAAIPPGQPCVGGGQALADDKFQPRQHPPQQCREPDGTHGQTTRRRMGADPAEHAGEQEPLQKMKRSRTSCLWSPIPAAPRHASVGQVLLPTTSTPGRGVPSTAAACKWTLGFASRWKYPYSHGFS